MIPVGAYDDLTPFEPKSEVFTELKLNWIRDNGCIKAS